MSKHKFFRKLSFLLALVMVMTSLCVPVMADTEETAGEPAILGDIDSTDLRGSGFTFTSNGFEEPATITGYKGDSWSDLVIPDIVTDEDGDHTVNSIGDDAFFGEQRLNGKLTLSKGLWVLNGAFENCTNLKTLIIDKDINQWADDAFSGCTGLTRVINYSSTEFKFSMLGVNDKNWYDSKKLVIDRIAEGTAKREDYVATKYSISFMDGESVFKQVEVEDGEKVEKPSPDPTDTATGEKVFAGWFTDEELTIPYDFDLPVTKNFYLYAGWTKKAGSGILFFDTNSSFWFTINEDGKTATIARNLKSDPVTNSYTQINSDLKIPEIVSESGSGYTVTGVGDSAFENKGYMGELILPDTLTDIGNRAFCGCVNLTGELQLPDTLKTIGDSAFMMEVGGSKLSGPLNFGSSLVSIGNSAFENCKGFTGDLILPDTLEKVGDYAFSGCTGFGGKIKLGNRLKTIGKYAFAGDRDSFTFSKYTGGIEIPATVTSIGERAFNNGQSLEGVLSIPLSGNLVSVGDYAFYSCSKLKGNLTFPQTLRTIGERAFADCKGLTGDLLIPDGVTVIGGGAFGSCTGLGETLTIGEGVERVDKMEVSGTYMELLSFMNCSGIKRVINKSDKVQVDLTMTVINNEIWTDAAGNTIKTIGKGVAYRSDYTGERIDPNDPNNPGGSVSGNVASDVKEEEIPVEGIEGVDKVKIVYPHKIPFFGKSKIGVEYFTKDGAKFTVSFNGQEYAVTKIKVNKKKKKIQITNLENADKKAVKAIKKATKGESGLDYDTAPYVVSDSDNVIVKFNKKIPDTIKSAKVMINNKYFNIKNKNDCLVFNPVVNAVTFKHDDVIGSSTTFVSK